MLDVALVFLVKSLNTYMVQRTGSDFGAAELGRLVDDAGKNAIKADRIGVALLDVEEERVFRAQLPEYRSRDGERLEIPPPLKVNLHVIFAAHFQQYDQALRQLSLVLSFFQSRPSFTPSSHPELDARIEKLVAELQTLSFEQQSQLWSFIGGKHLPSAVYKVRMVTVQDGEPSGVVAPIRGIGAEAGRQ